MKIIPEEEKTPDERLVHDFYFNTLKWCGCGNPDTALMYMRDVLAAMHKRSENNHASTNTWAADSEELYKLLNLNACEPLALSYLYMLDALGLTEHGGNVMGSWLTNAGEQLLDKLQNTDIERALS